MLRPGPRWAALITLGILATSPSAAYGDWFFTPFAGGTFAGSTAVPDLEQGATSAQFIFGGSAGVWSSGIFGVEADFAYAPRFFERDNLAVIVTDSRAMTLGANIVVATPVSVTRESLRPYLVAGLGWMYFSIDESQNLFPEIYGRAKNSIGLNLGGGAVGFISPRTGFRFELRQFRSLERYENDVTLERRSLLSFWRATVGVVIRTQGI